MGNTAARGMRREQVIGRPSDGSRGSSRPTGWHDNVSTHAATSSTLFSRVITIGFPKSRKHLATQVLRHMACLIVAVARLARQPAVKRQTGHKR